MKAAGFVEVDTGLEHTPVRFADAEEYREYVSHVIFHRHLERIPEEKLRRKFVDELTRLASEDDPPFVVDYWRLNLSGKRPRR